MFTDLEAVKRPMAYIQHFIDDELLKMIVDEMNLYSVRQNGAPVNTTVNETQ